MTEWKVPDQPEGLDMVWTMYAPGQWDVWVNESDIADPDMLDPHDEECWKRIRPYLPPTQQDNGLYTWAEVLTHGPATDEDPTPQRPTVGWVPETGGVYLQVPDAGDRWVSIWNVKRDPKPRGSTRRPDGLVLLDG